LYEEQRGFVGADVRLVMDDDTVEETIDRIEAIWAEHARP